MRTSEIEVGGLYYGRTGRWRYRLVLAIDDDLVTYAPARVDGTRVGLGVRTIRLRALARWAIVHLD